ncbi:endonuclease III domain-containing protein [Staphylococcus edaphicus]|uniref:Endonuclease III n=1 Tax=Staphylococcus edaphicus TaxID=1955013 RepID=A0A2C6WQS3_9STAP|nr:endonuclease III [Staphylococcus edaphicus]PHK50483.1 endonuclease III [Staphylococcus edaphicus]UQW81168.1 endonuclease III domain-containing protein [Staphylococcus edaphicus]
MRLDSETLYHILYKHMGPQGWWPAESKIEIILGAILVQNTNWRNAAYAIDSLKQTTQLDPQHILNLKLEDLQVLIKSSGFYKNKAQTILALLSWLQQGDFDYKKIANAFHSNLRNKLLSIKGIGSETADVLIVYVFEGVEFIPDSYTRRIYQLLGYEHTEQYDKLKRSVSLPETFTNQDANEFHALLDNFGKNYFNGKAVHRFTFLDKYFESVNLSP